MIKIIKEAQVRSEEDNRNLRETVAGIISEIRMRGDALLKYNRKFGGSSPVNRCHCGKRSEAARLGEQELADLKQHHNIEGICERAEADRETA